MRLACVALLLASAPFLLGQSGHFQGVRVPQPPKIDGVIEDSEWGSVPFQEGFLESTNDTPEPHKTRFWIAYDEKFVYLAARMDSPDAKKIVGTETHVNGAMSSDDYFEIQLDPGGALSEFNFFRVNPLGTTRTQLAGGRAVKREWAGEISAKARITPTGWEFEAAIPWQLMRLGPRKVIKDLRMNAIRNVPADGRQYLWRFTTNDARNFGFWDRVEVPAAKTDRSIQLLPYGIAGYDPDDRKPFSGGLDVRTKLNQDITAVGTLNPDFRNVENAILSIDFSRFERLAAETRPFMLEGGQYIGGSAIFTTQRIGSFDTGAKLYGRLTDKASFGFLNATNFGKESDTAVQYDRQFDDQRSSRISFANQDTPFSKNKSALINYGDQLSEQWYAFTRQLGSDDSVAGKGFQSDYSMFYGLKEWTAGATYTMRSPNLLPRLGFVPNVDIKGPSFYANYSKNFDKRIRQVNIAMGGDEYHHFHGGMFQRDWYANGFVTLPNQLQVSYGYSYSRFDGVDDATHNFGFLFPANNARTNFGVNYTFGTANNDPYRNLALTGSLYLLKKLQLSSSYQRVHIEGVDSDQFILGGNYDMDDSHSIAGRVVRADSKTNAYLSFRKAGNKGLEYYLILGDPNAAQSKASILLKVVVPITVGG